MRWTASLIFAAALLASCTGDNRPFVPDDAPPTPPPPPPPPPPPQATYDFDSKFIPGASSVAYGGQAARQVWLLEMAKYIDATSAAVTNGANISAGDLIADLDVYYRYTSDFVDVPLAAFAALPALTQTTMGELSTSAQLRNKIAGLDSDAATVMHKDWATGLQGWSTGGVQSPDGLVQYLIAEMDALAASYNPVPPTDPHNNAITKAYVTPTGIDLRELTIKFLMGAVSFSQAADDYLDDATPGKGLLTSNLRAGEEAYTGLEHVWDEGFGYFGASRNYGDYSDDELAAAGGRPAWQGFYDRNDDGAIDLTQEYNFGASVNAAKRDRGSADAAPTDFTQAAWDAFTQGRAYITSIDGELSAPQLAALTAYRDQAVGAWEQAIAATAVHYLNAVLKDMNAGGAYDFLAHAKHWSELKGFALAFQFNPRSPMLIDHTAGTSRFVALHALIGDAPVLLNRPAGEIADYQADLIAARAILGAAYGFDAANLGDAQGLGGW